MVPEGATASAGSQASMPGETQLSVDWGGSSPVVYALASDGTLSGLWQSGDGEETLTPDH